MTICDQKLDYDDMEQSLSTAPEQTTVTNSCNDDEYSSTNDNLNCRGTDNEASLLPSPLYSIHQRVYAKDVATGLLYPAIIRRIIWGPKDPEFNLKKQSSEMKMKREKSVGEIDDEDFHRWDPIHNCHHYYIHYIGWNVKWDQWLMESLLYEDSKSTQTLTERLMQEYAKIKPTKRGQKMNERTLKNWMKQVRAIEFEFDTNKKCNGVHIPTSVVIMNNIGDEPDQQKSNNANTDSKSDIKAPTKTEVVSVTTLAIKEFKEIQHNQMELREKSLQHKRKRSHVERLHIPFNLKKVLVDEWEVITQCNMIHDLPSTITVRHALDKYFESKAALLGKESTFNLSEVKNEIPNTIINLNCTNEQSSQQLEMEKDWISMVDGIALLFDQTLPIHLLYPQERNQFNFFRRQVIAQNKNQVISTNHSTGAVQLQICVATDDDNSGSLENTTSSTVQCERHGGDVMDKQSNSSDQLKQAPDKPISTRMSEIYGCEHLLRLFVRLPAVVANSSIPESELRHIFSKLGDFVRFLQKHQSELFLSSFRKPLLIENGKISIP